MTPEPADRRSGEAHPDGEAPATPPAGLASGPEEGTEAALEPGSDKVDAEAGRELLAEPRPQAAAGGSASLEDALIATANEPPSPPHFAIGERVCLAQPLRYLKTAEPMPMLRPPDLVESGEVGTVSEIRSRDQLAVRFRRGSFLIDARDLRPAPPGAKAG